jgi:MFS family permease
MVFVSTIVMTLTFGVNYSFGIFFTPLRAEFGWTKAVTSVGYSVLTFMAGFLGIFAGRLTDRFGARMVSIVGGFFLGLGCILMSQIVAAWQFYLIYALIVSAGIGGAWPSLTATVPKWFVVRRGLMIGIVASGTGIGTMVVPPVASRIILGAFTLVFIVIAAMFMRRDPHQMGERLYGESGREQEKDPQGLKGLSYREIIHNWHIRMVCIIYFCFGFSLHTIMVHLVPHAIETGIPPETAAGLMTVAGGAGVLSKLLVGAISDRLGVRWSLALNFILLIVALLWLQMAESLSMLRPFAFAFGFAYGGIMGLQSVLSANLFGLSSLGLILGSVSFIYTIGSALGPLLSSYIFDITGSYRSAFFICALLDAVALIVVLTTLTKKTVGNRGGVSP